MSAIYNKKYFIRKFEKIPEGDWTTGEYESEDGKLCAGGHCGANVGGWYGNEISRALYELLKHLKTGDEQANGPGIVNDGRCPAYQQPTPKQRILAALRDLP